jgi:predicted alpha/beta-hydrolase family hydrolase
LHPAGKPSTERAKHLADVQVPMLFLQGTRDALADLELIRSTVQALGARATLHILDGADHAFHVLARSGRTDQQVREELLDTLAGWLLASPTPALPGG